MADAETLPIFAYGSNMCWERIRDRTPSVESCGTGFVTHRRLVFHKRGIDGSGKADARYTGRAEDRVWGVLHVMSPRDRQVLDGIEGGYVLQTVDVSRPDGALVRACAYVALDEKVEPGLRPTPEYLDWVLRGARELGLPPAYVAALEAVEAVAPERHDRG